ncbi:unnamed protein product, partial [marine sediment metagenome]
EASEKPKVNLSGELLKAFPEKQYRFSLSLSYTPTTAVAVVLLENLTA